jgi:hypothetical protein
VTDRRHQCVQPHPTDQAREDQDRTWLINHQILQPCKDFRRRGRTQMIAIHHTLILKTHCVLLPLLFIGRNHARAPSHFLFLSSSGYHTARHERAVHIMKKEVSGLVNRSPAFLQSGIRLTSHARSFSHQGSTGEDRAAFRSTPTVLASFFVCLPE